MTDNTQDEIDKDLDIEETTQYQDIDELEVREQCRDRISIWYGSKDNYYHGVLEVLMNANDEVTNNFDFGEITVSLDEDKRTITVEDTGRGIPIHETTKGRPNYEVLFCTLFTGTNYKNLENGKITTGANGVGTCVLNHTSELFRVESYIDGKAYTIEFVEGGALNGELQIRDVEKGTHGTKITFRLDPEVYPNTVFEEDVLEKMLYRLSGVSNKIAFRFKYMDVEKVFKFDTTLEYFKENIDNPILEPVEFNPKTFEIETDKGVEIDTINVLMGVAPEVVQQTFLNYTYLKDHGTIYDGIISGAKKAFNKNVKNKFTDNDVELAFSFVGNVLSNNVEFSNQTKFSTDKEAYKTIAEDYILENLTILSHEDEPIYTKMLEHLLTIQKFNSANTKKKQELVKKLTEKVSFLNKVKKFVDCKSKDKWKRELYIVEGDSALGSCKLGRNSDFQAVMPVRGKILNCLKATYEKIFESDVILDLVKIIGCGIEVKSRHNKDLHTFNLDDLNWDKIIICTDGDVDGFQIRTLILVMIYRLMPSLIKEGKVYIAETPLYEINMKDEIFFAYSEKEKNTIIEKLAGKKYKIQRSKGLGENSPEMMWETTMCPETRRLTRVTITDVQKMHEYFELFLGDDVEDRKTFIAENGYKYVD